jgi:hypothetical protein
MDVPADVSVVPIAHIAAYRRGGDGKPPALVELDLDGSNFRERVQVSGQIDLHPSWSSDGADVLFTDSTAAAGLRLWRADASGGLRPAVTDAAIRATGEGQINRNGTYLFFYGTSDTASGIWRAGVDGSAAQLLVRDSGADPSPSAGATMTAFTGAGQLGVAIGGFGSPASVHWLGVRGSWPRFGSAGGLIAYTMAYGTEDGPLAVISYDGSGQRVVAWENVSPGVDWSYDGAWLLASHQGHLVLIRLSDGLQLPLHLGPGLLFQPAWKP